MSPLDLRRKAKLRTLVHALVIDTVEAALVRCKSPPQYSSSQAAPTDHADPRVGKVGGGAAKRPNFAKMQPPPPPPPVTKTPSAANGVVAGGGATPAAEQQQPKRGSVAGKPAVAETGAAVVAAATGVTDASLSVRRWPSPDESAAHPLWKMSPATTPGQRSSPEPTTNQTPHLAATKQTPQLPGGNPGPTFGAAVAPPMTAAAAAVAAAAMGPSGRVEGGVRSPSLMGLGSPRPPGTFVSRRREARRELAVNDADERMSWSSFDSLDVRVDDQV